MNIITELETRLATHIGTAASVPCIAAHAYNVLPDKPYAVVKADVTETRQGSTLSGTVAVTLRYNPTQGLDNNGSGDEIFDTGEAIQDILSDDSDTLAAINAGTAHLYYIMRFAGGSIEQDENQGRAILLNGYWSGTKI